MLGAYREPEVLIHTSAGVLNRPRALTGDDSYILTVQPGADLAFFVAVTISLNDILNPDMA